MAESPLIFREVLPVQAIPLCNAGDLHDGGDAVPFDVMYLGESCRAFAIRYNGQAYAYLNRCTHVPMELDYQPNRIFDDSGEWLLCATHGAAYRPDTGDCGGGPCRGGLVKIALSEQDGVVHWHTRHQLQPVEF
ncbi:nitrite reductase/ring-hydroxylating ferredoxin subunit [Rhodoferax ferrireducens]|uniref:Nitrite reductase/ring-hydroxylating ferredoxin subunit n=1 Tax=Rhodoferax ferrireducens TaxID=192843 RepID=A0ABU2C2L1_9BURK|nr:Rieske 2Fe-2S domain-containing protein [Rhodoferax ferrireducens]MDR7375564.1 nitrite reductase/ring-hydroxylating ferredoxin subunit [Rhodoferax ferrireducens]